MAWLFKKEWLEMIRDRRALLAAFTSGVFGPILMLVLFDSLIEQQTDPKMPTMILSNIKQESYLTQFLKAKQVEFTHQDLDLDGFKRSDAAGWLVKEDDRLTLYTRLADRDSTRDQARLEGLMQELVRRVANERLMLNGINLSETPFEVRFHEVQEKDVRGERLLSSLLIFILIAPFFAALAVANDATAGERERGTLMSLMTQPITAMQVAVSKWGIVTVVGLMGLLTTLVANAVVFNFLPLEKVGVSINTQWHLWAVMLLVMLPVAMMGAALQIFVAISAKSFKEGTSYLTMVSMAPMLVAMLPMFMDGFDAYTYLPIVAQQEFIEQLLLDGTPNIAELLQSSAICLAIAAACVFGFSKRITQPNILQGY